MVKYELRSYSIGEIIGKSVSMYMENFFTYAVLGIILYLPMALILVLTALGGGASAIVSSISRESMGSAIVTLMAYTLGTMLLTFLFTALCSALVTKLVAANFLGEKSSLPKMGPLLKTLPAIMAGGVLQILCIFGGFILLFVPGVILGLGLLLSTVIIVLEGVGPIKGLKRSWALTAGSKGKILGLVILMSIITQVVTYGLGMVTKFLPEWSSIPCSILISGLLMPFSSLAYVILYFSLRVEKEAFDVEYLAQAFGEHPSLPDPASPGAAI